MAFYFLVGSIEYCARRLSNSLLEFIEEAAWKYYSYKFSRRLNIPDVAYRLQLTVKATRHLETNPVILGPIGYKPG